MKQPRKEPASWETNMERADDSVIQPVLKSNMRPAAADVVAMTTPQMASPEMTPPSAPPQAAKAKMHSLPYMDAMSQSVRPAAYALAKQKPGATT